MLSDPVVIALTIVGTVVTSIVAVVALGLRAIIQGQLVPGRTHDRMLEDKQDQIDMWKAAHAKVVEQRDGLMVLGHTAVKAVTSVAEAAAAKEAGT